MYLFYSYYLIKKKEGALGALFVVIYVDDSISRFPAPRALSSELRHAVPSSAVLRPGEYDTSRRVHRYCRCGASEASHNAPGCRTSALRWATEYRGTSRKRERYSGRFRSWFRFYAYYCLLLIFIFNES